MTDFDHNKWNKISESTKFDKDKIYEFCKEEDGAFIFGTGTYDDFWCGSDCPCGITMAPDCFAVWSGDELIMTYPTHWKEIE